MERFPGTVHVEKNAQIDFLPALTGLVYIIAMVIMPWVAITSAQAQSIDRGRISGKVTDAAGRPLSAATIWLLPDSLPYLSDDQGQFEFNGLSSGNYLVAISRMGYETDTLRVQLSAGKQVEVFTRMLTNERQLATVRILDEHAKQEELLSTDHLDENDLARNVQGNFAQSLSKLPGLDAINTGVGIAKPVIRGLSFNRIVVNDQGIKQQGQQWGADHGLEVDAFSVSMVEVVKGPASLQYGSDGLGGVINLMPRPVPTRNSVSGQVVALGKTNNQHVGGSAQIRINRDDFWVSLRYTRQDFGDYRVPADTFVFQSFVLPLFDGYLKNSAGEEENREVQVGLSRDWGVTRITYSHYRLESGLFSGAIGVPRSYALQPDGTRRDIDLPSQAVDHYKVLFNQTLILDRGHLNLNLGYQHNRRLEFGFPEFHNQPEIDIANTLALGLDLRTFSGNLHYEHHLGTRWKNVYGVSLEHQRNVRSGWEFLLPDFQTWRGGSFMISQFEPNNPRWRLSGGLRLDLGSNQSDFFQRYVWNSNSRIIDSLSVPMTDDVFVNWSGSLGGRYALYPERTWLKVHLGKSFRVPYPAETVSNGVHHGTFRHEQGNAALQSEQGYQFDLGIDWVNPRWEASFAGYVNFFDNFIYLGPSGRLSTLPEAGQIFRYQQNDAIYSGFELDWRWRITDQLELYQAAEYVWNLNLNTNLSLPFTPQPSLLSEISYAWQPPSPRLQEVYATLGHYYVWANGANRVDRNERPTPAYQLFDASVGTVLEWDQFRMEISLQGQNLLNTTYFNHLSRYRLINIPEQGRNIVLLIKVPFEYLLSDQRRAKS
ncbi:MAG: TonB-dependent receptor [Bacteroidota bacterium]